ncbi:macro domain-containing protein [Microbacterium karelineae]|uniref:macro domain-containing protein n=1 Tax=Microbacterium karelineae TaxID=2654283 RepID=UPI0012EA341C|nr:macro domain-containing protein [Microbacterium karelineae]
MTTITAVLGDIASQRADAVVNAASPEMRGGGGVDGAIHRAGGPAILTECVERFPDGLPAGDAGWTTAGEMRARWVIHTVGPNRHAGQTDRGLLTSCYRRSLEVADELGAHSVAFPLISAGAYGWPLDDAIAAAVDTLGSAETRAGDIRIVARDATVWRKVRAEIEAARP